MRLMVSVFNAECQEILLTHEPITCVQVTIGISRRRPDCMWRRRRRRQQQQQQQQRVVASACGLGCRRDGCGELRVRNITECRFMSANIFPGREVSECIRGAQ